MGKVVKSLLVCATPRSGSTLLCALLTGTGVAGRPQEYFERLAHSGLPRQPREYFDWAEDPSVLALLADAGVVAVVSLVSPMAGDRKLARELHDAAGLDFHEVFVSTPVEECERRDPKGLYARARGGKLPGFTGVDAPHEAPEELDFEFDTASDDGDDAVERLLDALRAV